MSPPAMDSNSDYSLTAESTVQHLHKGVKQLSDNGVKKLPRKYILPGPERPGLLDPAQTDIRLPLIDVSDLLGPARPDALARLGRACGEYGFFQVVGHGVDAGAVSAMLDVCRRFFEMPLEEREKYMSADMTAPVRCGTSFNQTKDRVFSWRDFLKLVVDPDSNDVVSLWPSSPTDFRTSALTYSKETKKLFMVLMEAIIESLGLSFTKVGEEEEQEQEDKIQMKDFQKGSQLMVSNCYPPCPEPELTLGMPPHSDYGFLTLLLQDSVNGLQIQHRGKWVIVEPIPNSFVVNVGDHLEIFSNGRYKSVLHRVLVNSERTRITVASLHSLPFTHVIKPSPGLVDDMNPSLYMETDFATFLEYISSREPKKKNFLESRKILYHSN